MRKITKAKARKLYDAGQTIYFHTNKLSWNNPWQNPCPVTKDFDDERSRKELNERWPTDHNGNPNKWIPQFDLHVNEYSFYNCDNERGNVVIYLIK